MSVVEKKATWSPRDNALAARRREEILHAAARFFAEYGYPDADLQILANQLGIGKGTLYRYFPSKEELFLAATDRGLTELRAFVYSRANQEHTALDHVKCVIRSFFAFFDANPHYVELLIQERAEFRDRRKPTIMTHREAGIAEREEMTRRLVAEGFLREMDAERIGDKINNMLYGTLFTNYFMRGNASFEEQADDVMEVIFCGVLSDKERVNYLQDKGRRRTARNGGELSTNGNTDYEPSNANNTTH